MMYALEHLVLLSSGECPQYQWKQLAYCANRVLLEKAKRQMRRPQSWRVVEIPRSLAAAPGTSSTDPFRLAA